MRIQSSRIPISRRSFGRIALMSLALGMGGASLSVQAQPDSEAAWPQRAITLVLGYPPGGINDVIARKLAAELQVELKVP